MGASDLRSSSFSNLFIFTSAPRDEGMAKLRSLCGEGFNRRRLQLSSRVSPRKGSGELDDEKPVMELGLADLDSACKAKAPLELPRGDAAMEKVAGLLFVLLAANGKLAVLGADLELIGSEACDRERDAQGFRLSLQEFDIVGRVAGFGLCRAVRPAGRGKAHPETTVE